MIDEILKRMRRKSKENHPVFMVFYTLIAQHFFFWGNFVNSLFLFKASLSVYHRIGCEEPNFLANIHLYLGRIYKESGDLCSEQNSLLRIYQIYMPIKLDYKQEYEEICRKLAFFYKFDKNFQESTRFSLESIEILEEKPIESSKKLIEMYLLVVDNCLKLDDFALGIVVSDQCFLILTEINQIQDFDTFQKIHEIHLKSYLKTLDPASKEALKKISLRLKNSTEKTDLRVSKTMEYLYQEVKKVSKFSVFFSYHLTAILQEKTNILAYFFEGLPYEPPPSLSIFSKLLLTINSKLFFSFFD